VTIGSGEPPRSLTEMSKRMKRSPTTKDIALLKQLFDGGQLKLAPEFQRNSVWPRPAKAYLIDTILNDKPIPILFFQRNVSAQNGRTLLSVIDGQQRLIAIFEFLNNRVRLTQSKDLTLHNKRFRDLPNDLQNRILNYDLVVEELSGYSEENIRDMFVRMNKYVVKLSPQELRHAKEKGAFREFVERLGRMDFWKSEKVFTALQLKRMRAVEFSAELAILLDEGPQDKKSSIDVYYAQYRDRFPAASSIESRLVAYQKWIKTALPDFSARRFRKPVDLYGLIGALEEVSIQGERLDKIDAKSAGGRLMNFEKATLKKEPKGVAGRYVLAASRQTDNILPRTTRIEVLTSLVRGP